MKYFFYPILYFYISLAYSNYLFCQEKKDTTTTKDTTTIIEDVKEFSQKDNFFSKLLRSILVFEEQSFNDNTEDNYKDFEKYEGKIIRNINVKVLDVFGPSVTNPNAEPNSWLQNTGNSIHIETHDWLIRNKLLFNKGDIFHSFDLAESERLIRQMNYVYDARITIKTVHQDSVDINVIVQDIWSITGDADYNPSDKSGFLTVRDLNFFGLGSEVKTTVRFGDIYSGGWNWDGSILTNNIHRTYFTGQIYHFSYGRDRNFGVLVNRDFVTQAIRWAGGVGINWLNAHPNFITPAEILTQDLYYNQQDLWVGYAFDILPFSFSRVKYNRFNIAVRSLSTLFTKKPDLDTTGIFQNNILYLGRIGYSFRKFSKDRFIFGLGRTEDIPVGHLFEFIFGVENGEFRERPYYGIRAGLSTYDKSGYIYGGIQTGAYRDRKSWSNGIISADVMYFTNLLPLGSLRMRHYIWNRFSYRYDPITQGQLLNINEFSGLRGFSIDLLGNKKFIVNYENNIFIPINFLDFQFAIVTFADFGLLASKNQDLFKSKIHQGYGIGLRIRNEHLVFPSIQLMFGVYPGKRLPGVVDYRFFSQSSFFYQLNNFQFSKPSVIEF